MTVAALPTDDQLWTPGAIVVFVLNIVFMLLLGVIVIVRDVIRCVKEQYHFKDEAPDFSLMTCVVVPDRPQKGLVFLTLFRMLALTFVFVSLIGSHASFWVTLRPGRWRSLYDEADTLSYLFLLVYYLFSVCLTVGWYFFLFWLGEDYEEQEASRIAKIEERAHTNWVELSTAEGARISIANSPAAPASAMSAAVDEVIEEEAEGEVGGLMGAPRVSVVPEYESPATPGTLRRRVGMGNILDAGMRIHMLEREHRYRSLKRDFRLIQRRVRKERQSMLVERKRESSKVHPMGESEGGGDGDGEKTEVEAPLVVADVSSGGDASPEFTELDDEIDAQAEMEEIKQRLKERARKTGAFTATDVDEMLQGPPPMSGKKFLRKWFLVPLFFLQFVLFEIVSTTTISTAILFWVVRVPYMAITNAGELQNTLERFDTYTVHVLSSLFVIVELLVMRNFQPWPFHTFWPMALAFLYYMYLDVVVKSHGALYYPYDGLISYARDPYLALPVRYLSVVLLFVVFFILWLLATARKAIADRCGEKMVTCLKGCGAKISAVLDGSAFLHAEKSDEEEGASTQKIEVVGPGEVQITIALPTGDLKTTEDEPDEKAAEEETAIVVEDVGSDGDQVVQVIEMKSEDDSPDSEGKDGEKAE